MKKNFENIRIVGNTEDEFKVRTDSIVHGEAIKLFNENLTLRGYSYKKGHMMYQLESGLPGKHDLIYEMKDKYMLVKGLDRCIFTGNTFYRDDASAMLKTMDLMLSLPNDLKIFASHEYTRANFDFLSKVEGWLNTDIERYWNQFNK